MTSARRSRLRAVALFLVLASGPSALTQFRKLTEKIKKPDAPTLPSTASAPASAAGVSGGSSSPGASPAAGKDGGAVTHPKSGGIPAPPPPPADTVLLAYTVHFQARAAGEYHADPKGPATNELWAWMPLAYMTVMGPVASGSQLVLEYAHADHKPWFSMNCGQPLALQPGETVELKCGTSFEVPENIGTTDTGAMPYKILLKNELQGKTKTLMAGTFQVQKLVTNPANNPKFNRHFSYYVVEDWNLPMGWIFSDHRSDEERPGIVATLWFKDKPGNVVAYLFHNGEQFADTSNTTRGSTTQPWDVQASNDSKISYHQLRFHFLHAKLAIHGDNPFKALDLSQNPGDYELKVLRNGKLARSMKFQVKDGKIVDASHQVPQGNFRGVNNFRLQAIVPVEVLGDQDGAWDANLVKTQAFYGNPIPNWGN